MDDFGVLVKGYGIKPQGKSAPMAESKTATKTHNYNSVNLDASFGTKPFSKSNHNSNSGNGSLLDDLNDDLFGLGSSHRPQNHATSDVFDHVFQIPMKSTSSFSNGIGGEGGFDFDMESMFKGSMNLNAKSSDVSGDDIWDFSGKGGSNTVVERGDLLSSDPVDDFWGKLGKIGSKGKRLNENEVDSDDLLPGFGRSAATNNRAQASSTEDISGFSSLEELEDFATGKTKKNANGHLDGISVKKEQTKTVKNKSWETNFIDIEGNVGGDSVHQNKVEKMSEQIFHEEAPDLDVFFSAQTKKSEPLSEDMSMNRKTDEVPNLFSGTMFSTEKKTSPSNFADDFSSTFGAAPTSGVFEEIEGETDERRRARLGRYQRAEARMAQALAEMNQREFQSQQEQEERYRIAEAMEMEMKRWAAGKEGNLRALLSSLQQVLAPELGWRAVTLTDLITSSQVKIAYKKAALCVHPDKVQQKGANLQQKYVAEKVFDLLKEAWNKFNAEELR